MASRGGGAGGKSKAAGTLSLVAPTFAFDGNTDAWVNAVVRNGGSVSALRKVKINDLVLGLKADGIWNKLDRLWLFAAENAASALTDIIVRALATNNNSTTFTADRGYTGDGLSMSIDSNFNASTVPGPINFTQNSACFFGWNNTTGEAVWPFIGVTSTTRNEIYPEHGGVCLWGINGSNLVGNFAHDGVKGLYLGNRTANNAETLDINGVQADSSADPSVAPDNSDFFALHGGAQFSTRQISCMGFGGGLSATERVRIRAHIQQYMGAVGNT